MIQTSLDVLWLVLAGGLGLLLLSLTVLVWNLVETVKRVNNVMALAEQVLDIVNTYIRMPAGFLFKIIKWLRDR